MDKLVEKIGNLAYEIVGVVAPGLAGLIIAATIVTTWLLGFGTIDTKRVVDAYCVARSDVWVSLTMGLALSYFAGHFLLWFSKEGWAGLSGRVRRSGEPATEDSWPRLPALRFLFLMSAPRPKKDVYQPLLPMRDASAEWLADSSKEIAESAKKNWRVFYLLATKAIAQANAVSLVDTYRNKYTLHRSLATALALGFWVSVVSIAVAVWRFGLRPFEVALVLEASICLILVFTFAASFKTYWDLLGETVVAESFILRHWKKKEK